MVMRTEYFKYEVLHIQISWINKNAKGNGALKGYCHFKNACIV